MQATKNYIEALKQIDFLQASETSLRTAFENYINEFIEEAKLPTFKVLHEGKRIGNFGVPDFRISFNNSMIGYIETKKTDENFDKILKSEQIKKYKELSNNLIITNYFDFILIKIDDKNNEVIYRKNLCYLSDIQNKKFQLETEKESKTEELLKNFFSQTPKGISTPKDLALALAVRCKNLKDFINEELTTQKQQEEQDILYELYKAFKINIFAELNISEFSDAFAQMLAYGLFLAGLNADTKLISIKNAQDFIPSNFQLIKELYKFFEVLEKPEYKETKWIIDETISIINNIQWVDLKQNLSFIKKTLPAFERLAGLDENADPYIYFYEPFLATYDYNLRKSKGVYYTPPQVVNFIVRAIDEILINTFQLSNGFADRNKVTVLDFATGTGTFLLEVFKIILENIPKESPEKRKMIIQDHILKNLYGFEYLIAPYTIAHLKLSQFLKENGYEFQDKDRLQVFLTNTLEPVDKQLKVPFMPQLSKETQAAQEIIDKPILVITGNPPYSGISKNNGKWISEQINKYKFVDGAPFGEKKHWLNDDYVKFIRFAQDKMDNVEQGIVGIITNHSFLDNPTFRGMRQSLMNTFDQLYFIDLHGNAKKKETTPEGNKDQNVFDIEQGVCISILVKKKGLKNGIFHTNFFGLRSEKYEKCLNNSIKTLYFNELKPNSPFYFFVPKDETFRNKYEMGWKIDKIFNFNVSGIVSARDKLCIHQTEKELITAIQDFKNLKIADIEIERKYNVKDNYQWKIEFQRKKNASKVFDKNLITNILYRPFDIRKIYYDEDIVFRTRKKIMLNMQDENIALLSSKQMKTGKTWQHCFVSNFLVESTCVSNRTSEIGYCYPLYILKNGVEKAFFGGVAEPQAPYGNQKVENGYLKTENFKSEFRKFIDEKYEKHFSPEQILGYIYAILHSETYRTKYSEFLKSDFPRILFTDSEQTFEKVSDFGFELIQKHLLKEIPNDKNYKQLGIYNGEGDNVVLKPEFVNNKLYINKTQYFETVPENVYNFKIGGYQVLVKYIKDRKNRTLTHNEIDNIENIVKVLTFTIKQKELIDNETKEWI